jgi:hypothetical protein
MDQQTMPSKGLCLPTSFAMALDVPVADILKQLSGWTLPAFPGLPEPLCWRGVHIQECIRIAQSMGFAVTPRELYPQVAPPRPTGPNGETYEDYPVALGDNWLTFCDVILLSRGVVTGVKAVPFLGVVGHAVAYGDGYLYDPNGYEYLFSQENCEASNFFPQIAWRVDRIAEAQY